MRPETAAYPATVREDLADCGSGKDRTVSNADDAAMIAALLSAS